MRKLFEIGGLIAGVVLIVFGAVAITMGVNGRHTVNKSLSNEYIVAVPPTAGVIAPWTPLPAAWAPCVGTQKIEGYERIGSTFNPKFGALWSPVAGLAVHASYGTSFRAPLLSESFGIYNFFLFPAVRHTT